MRVLKGKVNSSMDDNRSNMLNIPGISNIDTICSMANIMVIVVVMSLETNSKP